MKIATLNFALLGLVIFLSLTAALFAFGADPSSVVVSRNTDDVKGMVKLGDVSADSHMPFGSQANLRRKCTDKIKRDSAALGATVVLITKDEFAGTPINNVEMLGVAYGPGRNMEMLKTDEAALREPALATVRGAPFTEQDFAKVIVTRNKDDVKGLTRVQELEATSSMVFGSPVSLGKKCTLSLQKQAAKLGATTILITKDDFQGTPINNVNQIAVAYK